MDLLCSTYPGCFPLFPRLEEPEYNRGMNNTTVYIVFKEVPSNTSGNEFVGVFFDRKSAEEWIWQRKDSKRFFIESYEQPAAGVAHEVFA